jgi:hypothetical protein
MNVDVTLERIDNAAAIKARLQSFQPQNAMHDHTIRQAPPGKPNWLAAAENCTDGLPTANLLGNSVEAERGSVRVRTLADSKLGRRDEVAIDQSEIPKGRPPITRAAPREEVHLLSRDVDDQN